jgi:ElaB/YqjD/DUF883 family membrane-anchored ribosome-binding protein
MSNDYEKAVDTLMKDVKDLRADMKDILSALHGKARDSVETAKESLRESAAERGDQVREAARAVGRSCQQAFEDYAAKIGERPFVSLLAALGVGVILGGVLLRRRQ